MTKTKKIALILAVVLVIGAVFAGCQSYKWGPVGTTDGNADVVNNGSLAVQQGKYLYYINGMDSTSNIAKPEDNYFGKASVKGSIMKSEIAEDGSLTGTAVVVPKMFYTGYTGGGIYIFGDWIYYVTPTTKTDNTGVVQVSYLEYYRTKTDGTETQQITMVEGSSVEYVFTDNALLYYTSSTLYKVGYTDEKVDKDATVIAENVTDVLFNHASTYKKGQSSIQDYVYYTQSYESGSLLSGNKVYATDGGDPVLLADSKTYGTDGADASRDKQFTFTLVSAANESDGVVVYYSKSSTVNGSTETAGTFAIKFSGEKPVFDTTKEVIVAKDALTSLTHIGLENGVLVATSATSYIYTVDEEGIQNKETVTFSNTPTVIKAEVSENSVVLYYVISNKLMKRELKDDSGEINMSGAEIYTTWLAPTFVGDRLFYIDNTYNYTFVVNLSDFVYEANNVKLLAGKFASGYEESDKTKDGTIPKFMTDTDKETYITNNPKEEE